MRSEAHRSAAQVAKHIGIAAMLMLGIIGLRRYVVSAYRVTSVSMAPALLQGDWVLVERLQFRARLGRWASAHIDRGNLVLVDASTVVGASTQQESTLLKRVVAVAGDVISIRDGQVIVDRNVERPVVASSAMPVPETNPDKYPEWAGGPIQNLPPTKIPPGHVFVLGDNLAHSVDSRRFGSIPLTSVAGLVRMVHWRQRYLQLFKS